VGDVLSELPQGPVKTPSTPPMVPMVVVQAMVNSAARRRAPIR